MHSRDWIQLAIFVGALIALTPFLGAYLARIFSGELRFLGPIERAVYKLCGVDPAEEMSWKTYAARCSSSTSSAPSFCSSSLLTQAWLPLNPQHLPNVPFALAFNTAVSFMTNTNWQAYSGEATMSYFTQMAGLAVHNFVSAATGIAVAVALIRGLVRKQAQHAREFLGRPDPLHALSAPAACPSSCTFVLVATGRRANLRTATPRRPRSKARSKQIPLGPAASQIAIKQLGTNGGGFFGQNSAHPFENPTPLTNFLEILAIFLIPIGARLHVRRDGERSPPGLGDLGGDVRALRWSASPRVWWAELQPNPRSPA